MFERIKILDIRRDCAVVRLVRSKAVEPGPTIPCVLVPAFGNVDCGANRVTWRSLDHVNASCRLRRSDCLSAQSPRCTLTRPPLRCRSCALRLCVQNSRTAPFGFRTPPTSQAPGPFPKTSSLGNAAMPRLGSSAPLGCVPIDRAKGETPCRPNRPSPSSAPSATQPQAASPRVPSPIRCLNLSEHVAQKLHACTGPYSAGRDRDVLDILLIELLGKLDVRAVRAAAEQVFAERATHDFPPTVQIAAEWHPVLEVLAKELGYSMTSATEIESRFRAFVDLLTKA